MKCVKDLWKDFFVVVVLDYLLMSQKEQTSFDVWDFISVRPCWVLSTWFIYRNYKDDKYVNQKTEGELISK